MESGARFRLNRARWRLRGAWTWPAYAVLTVADAMVLHLLPPFPGGVRLVPALIVSSFANLFLIGAVAPWFARRLEARDRLAGGTTPREVFADRFAVILLGVTTLVLIMTGLGNRPLAVSETERTERLGVAVREYVNHSAPEEVRRNLETANTRQLDEEGFFRTCIALDDRTRAYCLFVDTKTDPPAITVDPDQRSNAEHFGFE